MSTKENPLNVTETGFAVVVLFFIFLRNVKGRARRRRASPAARGDPARPGSSLAAARRALPRAGELRGRSTTRSRTAGRHVARGCCLCKDTGAAGPSPGLSRGSQAVQDAWLRVDVCPKRHRGAQSWPTLLPQSLTGGLDSVAHLGKTNTLDHNLPLLVYPVCFPGA